MAFRTLCASHTSRTRFLDVQGCIDNHFFLEIAVVYATHREKRSRPWLLLAVAFLSASLLISFCEAIIQECNWGAKRAI